MYMYTGDKVRCVTKIHVVAIPNVVEVWVILYRSLWVCATFSIAVNYPGIHFEKQQGQHILKNPLIVNSMIEKVCTHTLVQPQTCCSMDSHI